MAVYNKDLRLRIITLRKQGYTYPEISQNLNMNIPKASMSYICRGTALDPNAVALLEAKAKLQLDFKRARALSSNRLLLARRIARQEIKAMSVLSQLDIDTAKIALAFLYWGEGAKRKSYRGLSLGNSDPLLVKTYIALLEKCYSIPLQLLRARVLCRADQNLEELVQYWSSMINLPLSQFYPGFKDKRTLGKPTKKSEYKGVCVITGGSADVQLELDAIARNFLTTFKKTSD